MEEEYPVVLEALGETLESLRGRELGDARLVDAVLLAAKLFFHAATIYSIWQGVRIPLPRGRGGLYYDHASGGVLARATYETYLALHYLFLDTRDAPPARELRHTAWLLGGTVTRLSLPRDRVEDVESYDELQAEADGLRSQLAHNRNWADLNEATRKALGAGRWRGNASWIELADRAQIGPLFAKVAYSQMSAHVHSDSLSIDHIREARTPDEQKDLLKSALYYSLISMALMLEGIGALIDMATDVRETHREAFAIAHEWAEVAWRFR